MSLEEIDQLIASNAALTAENARLKAEVEKLRESKRPFSDKLAQEVIDGQVKRITELEKTVLELRAALDAERGQTTAPPPVAPSPP